MKLEKEEIALYLSSYVEVLSNAMVERDKKFLEIFVEMSLSNSIPLKCEQQEYIDMIMIYCFYCNIKILSFFKDVFYSGIDEKDISYFQLNDTEPLNKECLENFSKKDIILYIRNALAHNDKENPLYWFVRDEDSNIKLHIRLENTIASVGKNKGKKVPFEIEVDLAALTEIVYILGYKSKSYHIFGVVFGKQSLEKEKKVKGTREENKIRALIDGAYYYRNFYKMLSNDDERQISDINLELDYFDQMRDIIGPKCMRTMSKKLSQIQKNTLYQNILGYTKDIRSSSVKDLDVFELLDYEAGKIIPVGITKVDSLYLSMIRSISFISKNSFNDSSKELYDGLCLKKNMNSFYKLGFLLRTDVRNFNERVKIGIMDIGNDANIALSIFLGYVLDSIISENEITIGNKKFERSRLRNSFVHGRWYVSERCFELFDGKKNEFEFSWHKSIDTSKLIESINEKLFAKIDIKNRK